MNDSVANVAGKVILITGGAQGIGEATARLCALLRGLLFFGRPARILQLRGSPLLDWEENLPVVPVEVHRANAAAVGSRLVDAFGGVGPSWL